MGIENYSRWSMVDSTLWGRLRRRFQRSVQCAAFSLQQISVSPPATISKKRRCEATQTLTFHLSLLTFHLPTDVGTTFHS